MDDRPLRDFWDTNLERAVVGYVLIFGAEGYAVVKGKVRQADFWLPYLSAFWGRMSRRSPDAATADVIRSEVAAGLDVALCMAKFLGYEQRNWERMEAMNQAGQPYEFAGHADLAVAIAQQIHALATVRRIGAHIEKIVTQALGA